MPQQRAHAEALNLREVAPAETGVITRAYLERGRLGEFGSYPIVP